ncbi:MAG: hypothetical protein IJ804_04825 [Prevotella sp.]|nr:hypothetical protein [Prevotella sp.]
MKTYMEPTLQVINIETQQMLAASDLGMSNENAHVDGGNYDKALSRGGSWDDEEDEDW